MILAARGGHSAVGAEGDRAHRRWQRYLLASPAASSLFIPLPITAVSSLQSPEMSVSVVSCAIDLPWFVAFLRRDETFIRNRL